MNGRFVSKRLHDVVVSITCRGPAESYLTLPLTGMLPLFALRPAITVSIELLVRWGALEDTKSARVVVEVLTLCWGINVGIWG